ncbi:MAG: type III-B CRISPR module-associated protein Cmr5 [Candidatus Odinarchaeota archaeon]|nr:type III-B CRISPR module-associated protein Cmr5 [Candidatus Odinarchaeota archaeon]
MNTTDKNILRTLSQERAKAAHACIMEVKEKENERTQEAYTGYVKNAAVYILTNGLGNTMAFYRAKIGKEEGVTEDEKSANKKAYELLYKHINDWISGKLYSEVNYTDGKEVLEWITCESTSSLEVMFATEEALRFIVWLKQFADAILKKQSQTS